MIEPYQHLHYPLKDTLAACWGDQVNIRYEIKDNIERVTFFKTAVQWKDEEIMLLEEIIQRNLGTFRLLLTYRAEQFREMIY
ncbi:uncharacterized protein I303_103866 [Kwoniella dejecticola CBS 10117]|uniref:Uncharacterized protein n=1 Tax=Kwoniella dejecticola CBS 10117 TaxID=1296121 RepID=A0A1A6A7Y2_9TREE|nr:uncharacterized protein I303_03885 [Kwoniella dejecticola CBS 10117]OBR86165.1 hypothetical protein I303_03885 [Kwoniella dejecticola CBS 10117]